MLRLPEGAKGQVICPHCKSRVSINTHRKWLPAFGFFCFVAAVWTAAVVPLTGHLISPLIALVASLLCVLAIKKIESVWAQRPIQLSLLRNGKLLFLIMAIVSLIFVLINLLVYVAGNTALFKLTIATILRLQVLLIKVLPIATIEIAGAIIAGAFALYALIFLYKGRLQAAGSLASISKNLSQATSLVSVVFTCLMAFSIVSVPAGITLVQVLNGRISEELKDLNSSILELETGVLAVFGEQQVSIVFNINKAIPQNKVRPGLFIKVCEKNKIEKDACLDALALRAKIAATTTVDDSEEWPRNVLEPPKDGPKPYYSNSGTGGGTEQDPHGGGMGIGIELEIKRRLTPYYDIAAGNVHRAAEVACSKNNCKELLMAERKPTIYEVFSAMLESIFLGFDGVLPSEQIGQIGGPFVRKIFDEMITDSAKQMLEIKLDEIANDLAVKCDSVNNCRFKEGSHVNVNGIHEPTPASVSRFAVHLQHLTEEALQHLAVDRQRVADPPIEPVPTPTQTTTEPRFTGAYGFCCCRWRKGRESRPINCSDGRCTPMTDEQSLSGYCR